MYRIANILFVSFLMFTFLSATSVTPVARAAMIDTSSYIEKSEKLTVDRLKMLVERQDVHDQLVALGVDTDVASKRIAAMSEAELQMLQEKIDEMPVGGDILAVLGVLLVVLIVLEILGVTNVFTRL